MWILLLISSKNRYNDFVAALGNSFYADETMIRNAIERRSSFNLIHLETVQSGHFSAKKPSI